MIKRTETVENCTSLIDLNEAEYSMILMMGLSGLAPSEKCPKPANRLA